MVTMFTCIEVLNDYQWLWSTKYLILLFLKSVRFYFIFCAWGQSHIVTVDKGIKMKGKKPLYSQAVGTRIDKIWAMPKNNVRKRVLLRLAPAPSGLDAKTVLLVLFIIVLIISRRTHTRDPLLCVATIRFLPLVCVWELYICIIIVIIIIVVPATNSECMPRSCVYTHGIIVGLATTAAAEYTPVILLYHVQRMRIVVVAPVHTFPTVGARSAIGLESRASIICAVTPMPRHVVPEHTNVAAIAAHSTRVPVRARSSPSSAFRPPYLSRRRLHSPPVKSRRRCSSSARLSFRCLLQPPPLYSNSAFCVRARARARFVVAATSSSQPVL